MLMAFRRWGCLLVGWLVLGLLIVSGPGCSSSKKTSKNQTTSTKKTEKDSKDKENKDNKKDNKPGTPPG